MTCVVCQHRPVESGSVCPPCITAINATLADIDDLTRQLPAALLPGANRTEHVSGTPEPPLPLQLGPLDLLMPARPLRLSQAAVREDQTGDLSVASTLDTWVRDWRTYQYRERLPRPTVPRLVRWLRYRLHWACDNHPAMDDFADEIRELRGRLRSVLGYSAPQKERVKGVPCRQCDQLTLFRRPGDERIHCEDEACSAILYPDEYERWTQLLAAHHRTMA